MSAVGGSRPALDEQDRSIATGTRALVEAAPALALDEVRARATAGLPSSRPRPTRSSLGWRVAAAAAVLVVVVGAVIARQDRPAIEPPMRRGPSAPTELLPVSADPTGPVAAHDTAASTGEPDRSVSADWDVVRTAVDDRQLVVYVDGAGGCTEGYRAEVTETIESVTIAVHPVPRQGGDRCPSISGGAAAIGIELDAPLGDRRLVGWTPTPGFEEAGPLVVRGDELFTLTWPAGSVRATTEDLGRALGPQDWVWTQRFTDPSRTIAPPEESSDLRGSIPTISLEQWHGAVPIDHGAGVQACRFQQPRSMVLRQVDGIEMTLVRCPDGSKADGGTIAVLWMDQTTPDVATRFLLRAERGSIDVEGLLTLAASVRRGG